MDDLDRMHRRLVQNIRASFPDYLTRPFEVAELYTTLIPYRHNRRELELETNQDYELALLRLLSGERGYVIGDPQMQEDLRAEIDAPNPDLSKFRAYSTTMVSLAPDGARTVEPPLVRRPGSGGGPAVRPGPAAGRTEIAERPTLGVPQPAAGAAPGAAPATPPPTPSLAPQPAPAAGPRTIVASGNCRYCGGELPQGKSITFCPHCGQNQTVINCPACGTELELGWKFCTTCGRAVG